jgi:hypothetical protein
LVLGVATGFGIASTNGSNETTGAEVGSATEFNPATTTLGTTATPGVGTTDPPRTESEAVADTSPITTLPPGGEVLPPPSDATTAVGPPVTSAPTTVAPSTTGPTVPTVTTIPPAPITALPTSAPTTAAPTTTQPPDTTPPIVVQPGAAPAAIWELDENFLSCPPGTARESQISVIATDNVAVDGVEASWTIGGIPQSTAMVKSGNTYTATFGPFAYLTVPDNTVETVTVTMTATDTSANTTKTSRTIDAHSLGQCFV